MFAQKVLKTELAYPWPTSGRKFSAFRFGPGQNLAKPRKGILQLIVGGSLDRGLLGSEAIVGPVAEDPLWGRSYFWVDIFELFDRPRHQKNVYSSSF